MKSFALCRPREVTPHCTDRSLSTESSKSCRLFYGFLGDRLLNWFFSSHLFNTFHAQNMDTRTNTRTDCFGYKKCQSHEVWFQGFAEDASGHKMRYEIAIQNDIYLNDEGDYSGLQASLNHITLPWSVRILS